MTKLNEENMTWEEWANAAGVPTSVENGTPEDVKRYYVNRAAWQRGEDPADTRHINYTNRVHYGIKEKK